MRATAYVYDSADAPAHVEAVLDRLDDRPDVTLVDVAAADAREDGLREASLTVKDAVRIGSYPEELYDESGALDFSPGALITEAPTGRRSLHVGAAALDALDG